MSLVSRKSLVVATLLAGHVFASSPLEARTLVVPAVAHRDGAGGSAWRSELVLANLGSATARVHLELLPGERAPGSPGVLAVDLAAGETRTLPGVAQLLGGTPASGALQIEAPEGVVVTSRTTSGGFGQVVPAFEAGAAFAAGEVARLLPMLSGPAHRANAGVVNLAGRPLRVTLALRSGDAPPQHASAEIPGGSHWQRSLASLFDPFAETAVLEVSADGPFLPYGSIVDAVTQDPFFVAPLAGRDATTSLELAAAAHVAGAAGTVWRTDVWLYAPGRAAEVTLAFHPLGGGGAEPRTATLVVPSRRLVALDDVLAARFGVTAGSGALRFVATEPVFAASRTATFAGTGTGRYGDALAALDTSAALGPGELGVFPLDAAGTGRLNVGLWSPSGATRVRLRAAGSAGETLAEWTVAVAASVPMQLNDVAARVPQADALRRIEVSPLDAGARLYTYLSHAGAATGDPANQSPLRAGELLEGTLIAAGASALTLRDGDGASHLLSFAADLPVWRQGAAIGASDLSVGERLVLRVLPAAGLLEARAAWVRSPASGAPAQSLQGQLAQDAGTALSLRLHDDRGEPWEIAVTTPLPALRRGDAVVATGVAAIPGVLVASSLSHTPVLRFDTAIAGRLARVDYAGRRIELESAATLPFPAGSTALSPGGAALALADLAPGDTVQVLARWGAQGELVAGVVLVDSAAAAAPGTPFAANATVQIVDAEARVLIVVGAGLAPQVVILPATVAIAEAGGGAIAIGTLRPGDAVELTGTLRADGTVVASHLVLRAVEELAEIAGRVERVDAAAGMLVVRRADASSIALSVAPGIVPLGENGTPVALGDFAPGMAVRASVTMRPGGGDAVTLAALREPGEWLATSGRLAEIDVPARRLVVAKALLWPQEPQKGQAKWTWVHPALEVRLAACVRVTEADGTPLALAGLQVGDQVSAEGMGPELGFWHGIFGSDGDVSASASRDRALHAEKLVREERAETIQN